MTAISSILDSEIRRNICADMLRVLRSPDPASGKPGGMILWYDFWLNPTNPQTRGVRFLLRSLFPRHDTGGGEEPVRRRGVGGN